MRSVSNILVVDDDPGIRLYLRRRLSLAGHDVVQASQAALAAIGQQPPDAIISVISLLWLQSGPRMRFSSAPVLALLEGGDDATVVAALDAGAGQCCQNRSQSVR